MGLLEDITDKYMELQNQTIAVNGVLRSWKKLENRNNSNILSILHLGTILLDAAQSHCGMSDDRTRAMLQYTCMLHYQCVQSGLIVR